MSGDDRDLGQYSLLELYRIEAEGQLQTLSDQLLSLERNPDDTTALEACMRAAHSLKGASRMVDIEAGVRITHALEELFVAAQRGELHIDAAHVDHCLRGLDLLRGLAGLAEEEIAAWQRQQAGAIDDWCRELPADSDTHCPEDATGEDDPAGETDEVAYPGLTCDATLLELFRVEVATHTGILREGLARLAGGDDPAQVEALLRAAVALKSAALLVEVPAAVDLARFLEEQLQDPPEEQPPFDRLRRVNELLQQIGTLSMEDSAAWMAEHSAGIRELIATRRAAPVRQEQPQASPGTSPAVHISTAPFSADPGMLELFRGEVESHGQALSEGLLNLEQNPADAGLLEALMRASHSIKGAARMVGVDCGVQVAHVMEDVFVAAKAGELRLVPEQMDVLLRGVDMLTRIAQVHSEDSVRWLQEQADEIATLVADIGLVLKGETPAPPAQTGEPAAVATEAGVPTQAPHPAPKPAVRPGAGDTAIRVSSESLNRLMGLAGEVRVESRWLRPFAESLVQIKHRQAELISLLDRLGEALNNRQADEYLCSLLSEARHKAGQSRHGLTDRLNELEEYDRRSHNLADRLNREVVSSRMRPFGDGVQGFQRMVRDLARSLGKQVKLEIVGLATRVDRDILARMEAPLNHLVRNAIDHGIESPEERRAAGKPEQATVTLEAVHSSGMLSIIVRDDGRGIDPEHLRRKVVEKGLTSEAMAADLSEAELMEFLFLPGFSTREQVTEISGRGVGLDVVHSTIQEMRGVVRAGSEPGRGLQFHMQLPLTLSVVRALLVEIGGEPYAFPLARIDRTLKIHRDHIESMENRQYFTLGNQHIGMVSANQVLELPEPALNQEELPIVVLGERMDRYGLVVDRFLGERNLVVQPLDPRLGKLQDVGSAAILENGTPCLIMDVDDLIRSIDILIAGGRLDQLDRKGQAAHHHRGKRVLVVDDSITVREVERNMLVNRGYAVDVAVDGMDGWNAVRTGHYDLVISDIDMPRMNGFEFVEHIKGDPALKNIPVMIVSYKDREEDRSRGLEAGADYYLTKGSFHDETLLDAVMDLIGEA